MIIKYVKRKELSKTMQDAGIVRGSLDQAQSVVVGKTTVYVHTNITEIPRTDEETGEELESEYEYNEIQYTKDEYLKLMIDTNESLQEQIVETQLALCELYEGGSSDE